MKVWISESDYQRMLSGQKAFGYKKKPEQFKGARHEIEAEMFATSNKLPVCIIDPKRAIGKAKAS